MKYYYKAVSRKNKYQHGFLQARSESEVVAILRKQDLIPIKIIEQKKTKLFSFRKKHLSSKDLMFFTRQISTMLSSGLTLVQSLRILKDQMKKGVAGEVVGSVINDIESGSTLSKAIGKFPESFSPVYIALVSAAESSGLIDKVLEKMARNLEQTERLKSQIKSAFVYPVIVLVLMLAVAGIMVFFVVPQLTNLYESLDVELPFTTQLLLGMSNFILYGWPFLIMIVILGVFFFRKYYATEVGRYTVDLALLKVPLIGKIIENSLLTEFARTFGLLVGSGAEIVGSIDKTSMVVGNVVYRNELKKVGKRVEKGVSVGDAMTATKIFPQYLIQMVRIGEQTGKLDESLTKASEYFEHEVEDSVKRFTTALEPAIMIILGLGVGFLLISVITPIYKLTSSLN